MGMNKCKLCPRTFSEQKQIVDGDSTGEEPEEDLPMCFMMLSRDAWMRKRDEEEEEAVMCLMMLLRDAWMRNRDEEEEAAT
ncbi:hypothetical protein Q3G72_017207 [Acer saccharum]|nr:hypothetical protein Q3G72_017207 [Acer saccharum]